MGRASASRRSGAAIAVGALVVALALLSIAIGGAAANHARHRDSLDRALASEARKQSEALDHYFARARSLTQVTASNPAFRDFYSEPGARRAKVLGSGRSIREVRTALAYLEKLFPGSVGEACFIDRGGAENARAVRGRVALAADLSPDESQNPFFAPTFALKPGQVYQARPYISPDTHDWVVSNSTPLRTASGSKPGIVHFEISLESFRRQAAATGGRFDVVVVEARSGKVILDSRHPQPAGKQAPLGRPFDDRFERLVSTGGRAFGQGTMTVGGSPTAFRRVTRGPHNANEWVVAAVASGASPSWLSELGISQIAMVTLALLLLGFAILSVRASQSRLRDAAMTDSLTGLGNRRRLMVDLEARTAAATTARPLLLAIFDLDGFKSYNDTFGHPAGDALLVRMAASLREATDGCGAAYRMGGDEFCVLAPVPGEGPRAVLAAASAALSEHGVGFAVTSSYGSILVPLETSDPEEALRAADQRMYACKNTGRASAGRQTTDVLLKVLAERYPELGTHLSGVTELAHLMAGRLGLPEEELFTLLPAASLHDIGKMAIPDAILSKAGPLDEEEWAFIRQHTLIGERVLSAAPSLSGAAQLVRSSHERFDGGGYPDGLSGEDIPLGSRIIFVCDAFDAMTSPRPYRPVPMSAEAALAELRAGAGTQFDPALVGAFEAALAERERAPSHAPA
jgi:diguanylate cyclase (GGDEF)-like protein